MEIVKTVAKYRHMLKMLEDDVTCLMYSEIDWPILKVYWRL